MQLTWDPDKPLLTGTAADLIGQSMTYNQHGELLTLAANAAGQPFFTEELTRDAGGRITTRTETIEGVANTYTYGYDPAGRLSSVSANGTTTASYTYDQNGNRLTRTTAAGTENGSYDDQDRVTSYGGATYTFNGAGDLTSVATSTGTTNTTYDELGNLTAVHLPNGDQIEYVIDAQNRRIGKKRNGTLERRWVWRDGLRIAAELDSSGNVVSRFVYGTGGNAPDLMIRNDETYELVKDHLGSVRVVIGTSDGAIVQRLDYDEYGNVTNDTAPGFQPFGFAGGVYDPDTKLVRFGARDYDPQTARWTAKDPIGLGGGDTDLYSYVGNDPINFADPLGLEKLNFLPPGDKNNTAADADSDPDDAILINSHGSNATVNHMNATKLARRIRKEAKTWKPGRKIILNSCNGARGKNSIAQQLSTILHTTVVGADHPVWSFGRLDLGTWGTYGADAEGRKFDQNGELKHEGVPDLSNRGHWVTFVDGVQQHQ